MRGVANPVRRIAGQFGGVTAMARHVGVGQATVSEWVEKGIIPSRRIRQVIEAGRRMSPQVILQPNDFFCASLSCPKICLLGGPVTSVGTGPIASETNESGEEP
jgi:hypothetical protein